MSDRDRQGVSSNYTLNPALASTAYPLTAYRIPLLCDEGTGAIGWLTASQNKKRAAQDARLVSQACNKGLEEKA